MSQRPTLDSLLDNEQDVTQSYYEDFGDIVGDISHSLDAIQPFIDIIRNEMLKRPLAPDTPTRTIQNGFINIQEWATYHQDSFPDLHNELIAIDGTYIFPQQKSLTGQVVGVAAAGLGYSQPEDIQLRISKSIVHIPDTIDWTNMEQISDFLTETESLIGSSSAPGTYMEFCERRMAIETERRYVILDGAIITQNLATRVRGIRLLKELLAQRPNKHFVGILKNLNNSDQAYRFHSRALQHGEAYVFSPLSSMWRTAIERRYAGSQDVINFIVRDCADIVRCVYRIGFRAFGFECHRDDLPFALVVLASDSQYNTPNYALPFLLQQVDRIIRNRFNPLAAQALINSGYVGEDASVYHNQIDERENR